MDKDIKIPPFGRMGNNNLNHQKGFIFLIAMASRKKFLISRVFKDRLIRNTKIRSLFYNQT